VKAAQVCDYEGYWYAVLGCVSATDIVNELEHVDATGLDEWLFTAELESWAIGGAVGPLPEAWAEFHTMALEELTAAVERESGAEGGK